MGRPPYKEELMIIDNINKTFPKEECYLAVQEGALLLYLRSLDLNSFKEAIQKWLVASDLLEVYARNNEKNIFAGILEQIENIGSYGIKGGKRVFVGYNQERKVKDRVGKIAKRGMHYYALDHGFSRTENKLPAEYLDKIICGDSEEVLKKLPPNCVDIVFTSPPYNFGLGYENSEDGIDWNAYFDKLFAIFHECIRVLKYGGRIIVNVQPLFSDYIPIHHIISNFFMENNMIWKGEILWEKNNYNCKYTAWGSWKSPSSPYLKYTWEFLEIYCKGDLKKSGSKENIDINDEEFKKWVVARWSIAPERNMKKYDHPAMFPEELVERSLKLFSFQNDVVLDPFSGVGTTAVVAKKTGRRYLGIDVSEEYCKKSELRLKEIL
ncbi:DNA methylase [Methanoculleus sediminis]|uniref:Type II methyltransferase n=1 Tax=Methanoculleus sediminis TaxID=1550566 RepID=A0A0H1R120_9EURY|nr:DNA methylase [Methanoculleus sediminis]